MQNLSLPIEVEDGYAENFYARNGTMQILLYTVPNLEYTGENITVEFILTKVRGNATLVMGTQLCTSNDTTLCT